MPKSRYRAAVCIGLAVAAVLAALVLVGCGSTTTTTAAAATTTSGATTTSAAATTTSGAATTTTGTAAAGPIKIGLVLPYSGNGQYYSKMMENGVRTALEQVGNKIEGRDIQVVSEDTAGDAAKGAEKAKKVVEVDKVDVVIPDIYAQVSAAIQSYLVTSGTPAILTINGEIVSELTFGPWGTTANSGSLLGSYAIETLGYKNVTTMFDDYAGAEGYVTSFTDAFTAKGGVVVQTQRPPLGTVDYAPYITQMKDADAAAIWFIPPETPTFFKQYKAYGKTMPVLYVAANLTDRDLEQIGAAGGAGMMGQSYYSNAIDTPANKTFVDMMTKKYGASPTGYEYGGYVATQLFLAAVTATKGNTEHKAIVDALKTVKIDSPSGPISFAGDNLGTSNKYILKLAQVNGKYVLQPIATFDQVKSK